MSKIAVIGTGYVGLVSGALLSDFGHEVLCVDTDKAKIERLISGEIPIYEPGLEDIVKRNHEAGRLFFTTNAKKAIQEKDIIFIAVGTPPREDGSADLQYVMSVADEIAQHMESYKVIVNKSTVPVGTGALVEETIRKSLKKRGENLPFDVVSNPEFLREGSAVRDFSHPDRVILGTKSEKALAILKDVYRVLYINETPFVECNLETAEMIKYASNAFLALKISYINEISRLCEKVGANVQQVAKAMGKDGRISPKFLHAGAGYGGSCFPKDTQALTKIGRDADSPITIIEAAIKANEAQKRHMLTKIEEGMGGLLKDKVIAVLGITFKPETDDMREAPSLTILPALAKQGAKLRIYDPQGEKEGSWRLKEIAENICFCKDAYDAICGAHAIVLLTEWNCFRNLNMEKVLSLMKGRYFFDLRNVYEPAKMRELGFVYDSVGR